MGFKHIVVGLDLSLTGAGVGVIDVAYAPGAVALSPTERKFRVATHGRSGKTTETIDQRLNRIELLADQIGNVLTDTEWAPSLVAIEEMPYGAKGGSAFDRAGLWWAVVRRCRYLGIPVLGVNVAKVKTYALGKGSGKDTDKDQVMAAAIRRYIDVPISNNNESDAFVLAAMGARLLGEPVEESLPQTHLRALDGLVLP